jgi:hypothetical protein
MPNIGVQGTARVVPPLTLGVIFHIRRDSLSEFGKKLHNSKKIKKNTLDMDFPIVERFYFY